MAGKKSEAIHDCKAECAELHRQLTALKKEVAGLKAELKKAPKGGGVDPRVDLVIEFLRLNHLYPASEKNKKKLREVRKKLS